MYHNSFYVAGRYNKYSRELPQTPWLLDGKRVLESSVEEMIADPLKKLVKMDGVKFGSSGREVSFEKIFNARLKVLYIKTK